MQIYKNPFEERASHSEKTATVAKIETQAGELFRHRRHAERYAAANVAALVTSYLCNGLSLVTSGIVLGIVLYQTILPMSSTAAAVVAPLLSLPPVLLIEALKRHTLKEVLINAIQYKKIAIGLSLVCLFVGSMSVFASWYGAKILPQTIAEPPQLVDVDSLRNVFEVKIMEATTLHTYKPTNTMTKQGSAIISELEAEKRQTLSEAKEKNEKASATKGEAIKADSFLLSSIALSIELLFLVCMVFSINFYWRCFLETQGEPTTVDADAVASDASDVDNNENRKFTAHEPKSIKQGGHQAPTNRPIGFYYQQGTPQTSTTNVDNENRNYTRICANCGTKYIHKHHKQKYCTDACRVEFWQKKTGKTLYQLKK
jgi:hypothetical protein